MLSMFGWMLVVPALAGGTRVYGPRQDAAADLGPLVGSWLEYTVRRGRRMVLERCDAADPLGIEILRGDDGFELLSLEGFESVRYTVLETRRDGRGYRLEVQAGSTPRALELVVDPSGEVAVLTWSGKGPLAVAAPSNPLPKLDQPDSECGGSP